MSKKAKSLGQISKEKNINVNNFNIHLSWGFFTMLTVGLNLLIPFIFFIFSNPRNGFGEAGIGIGLLVLFLIVMVAFLDLIMSIAYILRHKPHGKYLILPGLGVIIGITPILLAIAYGVL